MMTASTMITPVILSGGAGTRLWPLSRAERPKQFLTLTGETSMFQQTLARCADGRRYATPLIVANARHAALIDEQRGDTLATLILEPLARNTAPAIALAALAVPLDTIVLVMPSDHVIADRAAFESAIDAALPLVERGWLATFGITPDAPETGYGYIRVGDDIGVGAHRVAAFVEKPDLATAQTMVADGRYVWNGGIFLFRADAYLRALDAHAPAMLTAARAAMARAAHSAHHIMPDADAFAASPADSIDYAVMEKAERVAVIPVTMGWSDVGSWDALHALGNDGAGNAHDGDILAIDTSNCLLRSDGIRIAAVGITDLIVVASGDTVLILPRGQSQHVKQIVTALQIRDSQTRTD
jgi:mannose-1-phosphate guanylyltransferase